VEQGEAPLVLAFHDHVGLQYEKMKTFSLGLVGAIRETIESGMPIILVFDTDVGNSGERAPQGDGDGERPLHRRDQPGGGGLHRHRGADHRGPGLPGRGQVPSPQVLELV